MSIWYDNTTDNWDYYLISMQTHVCMPPSLRLLLFRRYDSLPFPCIVLCVVANLSHFPKISYLKCAINPQKSAFSFYFIIIIILIINYLLLWDDNKKWDHWISVSTTVVDLFWPYDSCNESIHSSCRKTNYVHSFLSRRTFTPSSFPTKFS